MLTIDDLPAELLDYIFKLAGKSSIATLWVSKYWNYVFKTFRQTKNDKIVKINLTSFVRWAKIPFIEWIHQQECPFNKFTFHVAIIHDRLDVLKRFMRPTIGTDSIRNVCIDDINYCRAAAGTGNIKILKWLRDPETGGGVYQWDSKVCGATAQKIQLKSLKWIRKDTEVDINTIKEIQLETLKWLRNPDTGGGVCPWNRLTYYDAAKYDYIEILKYFRETYADTDKLTRYDRNIGKYAAVGGNLEILKWCVTQGISLNEKTCEGAAAGGRIDILEWLRDPDTGYGICPWNERSCKYAAFNNNLKSLEWLRNPDTGGGICPWDENTCAYAATAGRFKPYTNNSIKTLEWLRDPDTGGGVCPWDALAVFKATIYRNIETLEWLRDPSTGGGVCPWDTINYQVVQHDNNLPTIKWLRNPDTGGGVCPWDRQDLLRYAKPKIKAWLETQAD